MTYRYTILGQPAGDCPSCRTNWKVPGGVNLTLSVAGRVLDPIESRLDEAGFLQDTDDGAVAAGYHAGTYCGGCGELLVDLDAVIESIEEE